MALTNQTEIAVFWKNNSINSEGIFKAMFIATKRKRPIVNSYDDVCTFNDLNAASEFGLKIPAGICYIDLDDSQQIPLFEKILKILQLKPLIIKTNRGKHYYFKTKKPLPHRNKALLACGIIADQKNGNHKNCLAIIKYDNQLRIIEQPVNLNDLPFLPECFLQTNLTNKKVIEWHENLTSITEGTRNNTLFKYSSIILNNIEDRFVKNKKSFLIKTIRLVNWLFLDSKITDREIFSLVNSAWSNYQTNIKHFDVNYHHQNCLIHKSEILVENWRIIKDYLEPYLLNLKNEYIRHGSDQYLSSELISSIETLFEKINWVNRYFEKKLWFF